MRGQIDQERASLKNLESLLQETREKDFQTQLSTQERNTEIQMLKDRLSLNDSKLLVPTSADWTMDYFFLAKLIITVVAGVVENK